MCCLALSCSDWQDSHKKLASKQIGIFIDSVQIYHLTSALKIPIEGQLTPWRQLNLSLPDSTRLLSILKEEGNTVAQGEMLASLWKVQRLGENTPIDLIAPFSGRIKKVFYHLNQIIPASKPILSLVNTERLELSARVKQRQQSIIVKTNQVYIYYNNQRFNGIVQRLDSKNRNVIVDIANPEQNLSEGNYVHAEIVTRVNERDFLHSKYFLDRDSLQVQLQEQISLTIYPVGTLDSLTSFIPPLPEQNFIRIHQKNLDL